MEQNDGMTAVYDESGDRVGMFDDDGGTDGGDEHFHCFSYPNCDIDPTGCTVLNGKDAEPYGHR